MGMRQITEYLRTIQEGRDGRGPGFSQSDLATAMGISLRNTNRWLNNGTAIKPQPFLLAVEFLKARTDHILQLLADSATDDLAHRLAYVVLAGEDSDFIAQMSADTSNDPELVKLMLELYHLAAQNRSVSDLLRQLLENLRRA